MKLPKEAKKVFGGIIFDVYQWEQKLFDGSTTIFERLKRKDSAVIIAVTDNKILIINDEQPARDRITCLPAGVVNENEEALAGAQRELLEETGYTSSNWKLLTEEQPYNKMDWVVYTYVALDAKKTHTPHLDPGERISSRTISFDAFIELARDNEFKVFGKLHQMMWEALLNPNKKAELKKELGL